jgi:hypothetical protein
MGWIMGRTASSIVSALLLHVESPGASIALAGKINASRAKFNPFFEGMGDLAPEFFRAIERVEKGFGRPERI